MFVSLRLLLKFALSRPPDHGMVFAIDVLKMWRWLVVRAPPSSWLVDWFVEFV